MQALQFSKIAKSVLLATAVSSLASVAGAASYTLQITAGGYVTDSSPGGPWWGTLNVNITDTFEHMYVETGSSPYVEGDFKVLSLSWAQGGDTLYSADGINFWRNFNQPGSFTSATAVVTGQTYLDYSIQTQTMWGYYYSGGLLASSTATPNVPVPGAAWLFGSALVGLGASRIKKQRS